MDQMIQVNIVLGGEKEPLKATSNYALAPATSPQQKESSEAEGTGVGFEELLGISRLVADFKAHTPQSTLGFKELPGVSPLTTPDQRGINAVAEIGYPPKHSTIEREGRMEASSIPLLGVETHKMHPLEGEEWMETSPIQALDKGTKIPLLGKGLVMEGTDKNLWTNRLTSPPIAPGGLLKEGDMPLLNPDLESGFFNLKSLPGGKGFLLKFEPGSIPSFLNTGYTEDIFSVSRLSERLTTNGNNTIATYPDRGYILSNVVKGYYGLDHLNHALPSEGPEMPSYIRNRPFEELLIERISGKIGVLLRDGLNRATIRLEPPSLGSLKIDIVIKDNIVRADIVTEHTAVKEMIEANLQGLKDSLMQQGLKLDTLSVFIGNEPSHNRKGAWERDYAFVPYDEGEGSSLNEDTPLYISSERLLGKRGVDIFV